ncbi:MAG: hypothetical protein HFI51_10555 [Lachnospiraceae bacterium]|nr:hypothetical protein [Lachnospiraceae bacterium]
MKAVTGNSLSEQIQEKYDGLCLRGAAKALGGQRRGLLHGMCAALL